jgi:hypothetical protein
VMELAGREEDSTGKRPYQAELSRDPQEGITFSDGTGDRSFTLTPKFDITTPRLDDGRVIYPKGSNEKHIYSFKKNGIKSDIVLLGKPGSDTLSYQWELNLPSSLEARMLGGGIGIFSADPLLFNAQAGDEKSQDLLNNAQQNGEKNTLIFELPAPFILDKDQRENYQDVSYSLKDNILTLEAKNLHNQHYPLTIDPTIVVTTTSDFQQKTGDTGNIDYGTDGEIRRGTAYTGEVGTWTTDASSYISDARYRHTSVAYNGYLYVIGGFQVSSTTTCKDSGTNQYCNDVQYAAINSDGSLGTFTTDTSSYFSIPRSAHTTVAYNGYLYVIGGTQANTDTNCKDSGSDNRCNDVQYAPINADGTLGTWTTDASSYFSIPRANHTTVTYGGYMYIIGGIHSTSDTNCKDSGTSTHCNDVQYAPINADGTLGTWTTDTSSYFSIPRNAHTSVTYNGYLYVIGGQQASSTTCKNSGTNSYCNDVQYAPINADGTLGTWTTDTTSYFSYPRSHHLSVVYNGYMYAIGGFQASSATTCKNSGTSQFCNDVQYAQVKTGGSGAANTDTSSYFSATRRQHASVAYNGYLYIIGGFLSASGTSCKSSGTNQYCTDVQVATINADGTLGTWATDASSYFSIARADHAAVAYNGYMYIIGGNELTSDTNCKDSGTSVYCNDVQVATINADGTLGTWAVDASSYFSIPRWQHSAVAYNGYMYIMGGEQVSSTTTCKDSGSSTYCNDVQVATINSDGTLGTWAVDSSSYFAFPRANHSSAVYNGYLYLTGGRINSSSTDCKDSGTNQLCNDVQYVQLNSDGTLGTWATDSSSYIAFPRYYSEMFAHNGYLYVAGGQISASATDCKDSSNNVYCNDVQNAQINSDGTLGAWSTDASSYFAYPRYYHSMVAYNGYLYITGGFQSSSATTCKDSGTSQYCNDVQFIRIGESGGAESSWTTDASSYFSFSRDAHTTVAYNGYLYVVGGHHSGSDTNCKDSGSGFKCNDVQYAQINADGTLGTWATDASSYFSIPRSGHTSVVYNGYIYIFGGLQESSDTDCKDSGSSQRCNDVQYAQINTDGTLGTWATDTSSYFSIPRQYHTSTVYNGYVYILGGIQDSSNTNCKNSGTNTECNDVQYAKINSDGTLGTWATDTSSYFSIPRYGLASVVYNGYLYVIGGFESTSDTNCKNNSETNQKCNDVQYAQINADGTLGTWTTDSSSYFTFPRHGADVVTYNGYMILMGGFIASSSTNCKDTGSSAYCNDVQYAQINADGSLGTWTTDGSSYFSFPRGHNATVIYNGYAYVLGGSISSSSTNCKDSGTNTYCNDVQYATLTGGGYNARYERVIDTGSSNTIGGITVNGEAPCGGYTVSYRLAATDYIFGSTTTVNGVLPGKTVVVNSASKRYVLVSVSLNDALCGELSSVSNILVDYSNTSNPATPSLLRPANSSVGISSLPEFRMGTTDADSSGVRYVIQVCSNSDCSSVLRLIDQTLSQTGWSSQSQSDGAAYSTDPSAIVQYAIHTYQPTALSGSTQYWWRAKAIDLGGRESSYSSIWSFTTGSATPDNVNIGGGTTIYGGTNFSTGN